MKSLIYFILSVILIFTGLVLSVFVPMQLLPILVTPLTFAAAFCIFEAIRSAMGK